MSTPPANAWPETTTQTDQQDAPGARESEQQQVVDIARFADLVDWVDRWLIPVYRRPVGDGRNYAWCPQWWEHPEALIRLAALWHGFEQARVEAGSAMGSWLRDQLDYHMRVLTDPSGPLKGCSDEGGHNDTTALEPWNTEKPHQAVHARTAGDRYYQLMSTPVDAANDDEDDGAGDSVESPAPTEVHVNDQ